MPPGVAHALDLLLMPFVDPGSRTWWPGLVVAALIAAWIGRSDLAGGARAEVRRWFSASSVLDVQLLVARQLLLAGVLTETAGALWLGRRLVFQLDDTFGRPDLSLDPLLITALYTVVLFVAWDASRFAVHWLLHKVPALWAFHQVHHSAEVMTPLTFHRVHPLESVLYQLRGALVTGVIAGTFFWLFRSDASWLQLFGVHAFGLVCNMVSGNLRHSHCWWSFGPTVERWLVSPAQHQLHHSTDVAEQNTNLGTWLAIWDRMAGTHAVATEPPHEFGVEDPNHGHSLLSAWFEPLVPAARTLVPFVALLVASSASAQDDDDDSLTEIIVYGDDGTPRVAGSAQKIEEEELERHEYDDIQRVLESKVAGVYARTEDGFGLRPNIGIRGANSDRSAKITLMEDGVLLAPGPYAAPAAYYFPMTTRMVGVEVFKGAAATQHGPNTVGGAINLLTRDVPDEVSAAFDQSIGQRMTTKWHAWAGGKGLLFEGVHLGTDGFKELDGGGPTGFKRSELMLKGEKGPFGVKLGYTHERSYETYLGLSAADFEANPYRRYAGSANGLMRWHRTQAELSWEPDLSGDWAVRTVAYHHYLTRQWTKFNRFAGGVDAHTLLLEPDPAGQAAVFLDVLRGREDSTGDDHLLIGTNDRRFHSAGIQTRAAWTTAGERMENRLELGGRVHADVVDRIHTEREHAMLAGELERTSLPTQTLLDSTNAATALALHAHDDLGIGRLHVLPGARFEGILTRTEQDDSVLRAIVLPGAVVLYDLHDVVDVFAGVHRGFSPVAPQSAPDVRPETSVNIEAGTRLGREEGVHAEVVGFLNEYGNLTGQCTFSGGCNDDQLDEQFNAGEVRVYGAELIVGHEPLLRGEWSIPMSLTYTFTDNYFEADFVSGFPQFGAVSAGDSLPYVPRHQGGATLAVAHPRFTFSISATGRSALLDTAGRFDELDEPLLPARALVDLGTQFGITPSITAYGTVNNVTGTKVVESWRPFGARPSNPTQAMLGLKFAL